MKKIYIGLLCTLSTIVFCSGMIDNRAFEPEVFIVEYTPGQISMPQKSNKKPNNYITNQALRHYRQKLENDSFYLPVSLQKVELLVSLDDNQEIHALAAHFITTSPLNSKVYSFCINQ